MNCFSHYKMGCLIYDQLNCPDIDKFAFASGNVSSDIVYSLKKLSHYSDNCMLIIKRLSEKLIEDLNNNLLSKYQYSYRLGQITHFIADYYCYAHDVKRYQKNLWSHMVYEVVLDYKLHAADSFDHKVSLVQANSLKQLLVNLETLHCEYINVANTYMVDLNYIVNSSYGFMLGFIRLYNNNYSKMDKILLQKL